jgi:glycerol uptake facilitator-like aquaporin
MAEAMGTSLLLYVIVGSGVAANTLSADRGVELLVHAMSVGAGLGALIAMLQTVSGSHFNPSVTLAFWRSRLISARDTIRYVAAQILGAIVGVIAANWSFDQEVIAVSATLRSGTGLIFSESIATFVLALIILALFATGRSGAVPVAVGAWVATSILATSSTGFANPAVTVARIFTSTNTGIAPASAPAFILAQLVAALVAAWAVSLLLPVTVRQQAPV